MVDAQGGRMAVGVCTYNGRARIGRTLRAASAMDVAGGRISRIVVVDNNSSDGTADVVYELARKLEGIPIEMVSEPTPGKSNAIARLFAETDEEFVGLIDDDTIPDAGWGRALLELLDGRPRCGIAGGRVEIRWLAGPSAVALKYVGTFGPQDYGDRRALDDPDEFLVGMSQAIRRDAMLDSGWLVQHELTCLRGERLASGEDVELCAMVRNAGWELWFEPEALLEHCIDAERQSLGAIVRTRGTIYRNEPYVRWLSHGKPGVEWVRAKAERAERQYRKTRCLEWRPERRAVRLAERAGKREGWKELLARLERGAPTGKPPMARGDAAGQAKGPRQAAG